MILNNRFNRFNRFQFRMLLTALVCASFLVLAPPILADEADETSKDQVEAPGGETASPVDTQPPAEPSPADEEDDSKNE